MGSTDLYLTGGEPLLRRDLPTIVAAASDAGVRTHVTTKYAIDAPLARTFARSRLTSLEFSLDDPRPAVAARLSGSAGFLSEATRAIRSAVDAGLRVSVAAVVLRENAGHLGALAALVRRMGAHKLTLNELRPSGERASGAGGPDPVPLARQLTAGMAGALEVEAQPLESRSSSRGRRVCDVGWRTLDLLPDGVVTRCRYRPDDRRLNVGSLATEDLLAVWRGRRLRRMVEPSRSAFAGTRCARCEDRVRCTARGWCVASTMDGSGHPFGPDAFCTRVR
jgi:MoaA/NifB/PqqE/SkfB family radical SAM enzyme